MILASAQPPDPGVVPVLPLAARWRGLPGWQILDTCFGGGQHFLETWHAWQQDTHRPQVLHYVALCQRPPTPDELLLTCTAENSLLSLARTLSAQWFGLLPGFHRFLLADGQVILTLCVGDAIESLRQQAFHADEVMFSLGITSLPGAFDPQSVWAIKALARCCQRGTLLHGRWPVGTEPADLLQTVGFVIGAEATTASDANPGQLQARFDPPWTLKASRHAQPKALPVQRCAVIGAGLAGASVAAALARRGWQVTVVDGADAPAAGASSLPVGLVVPHTSSDDCPLSRLSRAGARLTLQLARQYLQEGTQWAASGVLERQVGGTPQLPAHWPPEGQDWSTQRRATRVTDDQQDGGPGLWHPSGAWLKPAELVRAWLSQPGVVFQGNAEVTTLQHDGAVWHLRSASGQLLCSAERVVFANACGMRPLLDALGSYNAELTAQVQRLPATHGMRGLLSWALHMTSDAADKDFPRFPVNGYSSLVPRIPTDQGRAWFIGSSYQPDHHFERSDAENHLHNFEHLQQLLPALSVQLAATFASDALQTWKGTRCVIGDRLPLVGPLDEGDAPSLWICAGLGSRGLSFSVLCAELLAARMGGEPLPVEVKLAKALNALRG